MPQENPDTNTQNEMSQSNNTKNYLLTSKGDIVPIGNKKSAAIPAGWANFVVIAGTEISEWR